MNMQQLMMQAQKMQRDMQKKQKELEAQTFHIESAGGAITIDIKGTRQIEKIEIDEDAIDPQDKGMLEDMIKIAINDAMNLIDVENEKITKSMTSGMRMPF